VAGWRFKDKDKDKDKDKGKGKGKGKSKDKAKAKADSSAALRNDKQRAAARASRVEGLHSHPCHGEAVSWMGTLCSCLVAGKQKQRLAG
jgi:hypothetical protein